MSKNDIKTIVKKLNSMGCTFTIDAYEDNSIGQRFNAKAGADFESGPCLLIYKKQKKYIG